MRFNVKCRMIRIIKLYTAIVFSGAILFSGVNCQSQQNEPQEWASPQTEASNSLVRTPGGMDAEWQFAISRRIANEEYRMQGHGGMFVAPNREQGFSVQLGVDGLVVTERIEGSWTWTFAPIFVGRGEMADSIAPVRPSIGSCDDRMEPGVSGDCFRKIEYHRQGHLEWYANRPEGLEHGFIIEQAPHGSGPLVIEAVVGGDLQGRTRTSGGEVIFSLEGVDVLRYHSLVTTDAAGCEVPGRIEFKRDNGNEGRLRLIIDDSWALYPLSIDPYLSTFADWTAETNQEWAYFGYSVSDAGDVNGDGYGDVIVGASAYDHGEGDEGRAFVYYGSDAGLSATPDWTAEANQAGAAFGGSVSSAGDVNGDGYSDVIVGAIGYDNGENDEGRAFVYYGSAAGLSATPGWTAEVDLAAAYFGYSVSDAGDVNGDGYDDVIVGAYNYSNGETQEGAAFVYHGSAAGLSLTPAWSVEANRDDSWLGISVNAGGDVNGDGYDDVIVGALYYDNGEEDEGRAFVFHGSAAGLSATPDWTAESNQYYASFGRSVSGAGDVNGDGFSDVIIGADNYDNGENNEGRAFVYHGSAAGLSATPVWTAEADSAENNFGVSVSDAGDVNGDGYDDVIVGAYRYGNGESEEGGAFLFLGSASGLSAKPNWKAESNQQSSLFGVSVSHAGDVNGDGYSDVIIGAYLYDNGEMNEGRVFVYHGLANLYLSEDPNWTAEANQNYSYFGISVSTAGDVNGDGYDDVIVGAHEYSNGQTYEGRTFVYHGSAAGSSTTPSWTAEANLANAFFGVSVSSAGDVNGDGYDDVIVGAPEYTNGEEEEGRAFVYHGSAVGLSTTPNWNTEINQIAAYYGESVSGAGDINGDGYDDVIVGAYWYTNGENMEGGAFTYLGSAAGLSTTPAWSAEANLAQALFGDSVSGAGDVNGDGYDDVIVGASGYTHGEAHEGRVFGYYGSAAGLSLTPDWIAESNVANASFGRSVSAAGDVNGDGYDDIMIGAAAEARVYLYLGSAAGLSATPFWTAESDQAESEFGSSVSGTGDVNGDGCDDVIVGAQWYNNGQEKEGTAYVYYGSPVGLSLEPNWTEESNQSFAYFGAGVSGAGDVNGDGYSDVIVGSPGYDNGQSDEGRAFIYYGGMCLGCEIDGRCIADGTTNPDNECQFCDIGLSIVSWSDKADDVACNDRQWCTVNDRCTAGLCSGVARNCNDGFFCNGEEECDEDNDQCSSPGDPCAGGDACNNTCNEDSDDCFSPNTTSCDDGLFCTGTDTCDGAGTCNHTGDPCVGGAACNNTCNEGTDDCFSAIGDLCDDALFCTGADTCDGAGTCDHAGDPCPVDATCNEETDTCDLNEVEFCVQGYLAGYWTGSAFRTGLVDLRFYDGAMSLAYEIPDVTLDETGLACADLVAGGVTAGDYTVGLAHANHLDVRTATPVAVSLTVPNETVDFTDPTNVACGEDTLIDYAGFWSLVGGDGVADGVVNMIDFSNLYVNWNSGDPAADFNGDGVVNMIDFSMLYAGWGRSECDEEAMAAADDSPVVTEKITIARAMNLPPGADRPLVVGATWRTVSTLTFSAENFELIPKAVRSTTVIAADHGMKPLHAVFSEKQSEGRLSADVELEFRFTEAATTIFQTAGKREVLLQLRSTRGKRLVGNFQVDVVCQGIRLTAIDFDAHLGKNELTLDLSVLPQGKGANHGNRRVTLRPI